MFVFFLNIYIGWPYITMNTSYFWPQSCKVYGVKMGLMQWTKLVSTILVDYRDYIYRSKRFQEQQRCGFTVSHMVIFWWGLGMGWHFFRKHMNCWGPMLGTEICYVLVGVLRLKMWQYTRSNAIASWCLKLTSYKRSWHKSSRGEYLAMVPTPPNPAIAQKEMWNRPRCLSPKGNYDSGFVTLMNRCVRRPFPIWQCHVSHAGFLVCLPYPVWCRLDKNSARIPAAHAKLAQHFTAWWQWLPSDYLQHILHTKDRFRIFSVLREPAFNR